jgi:hypothetical protein
MESAASTGSTGQEQPPAASPPPAEEHHEQPAPAEEHHEEDKPRPAASVQVPFLCKCALWTAFDGIGSDQFGLLVLPVL